MYVVRTRFESLDEAGNVYSTTYGARVYDDIESAYVNLLFKLDDLMALDATELLDHIKGHSEAAAEMLSMAEDGLVPLFVDEELIGSGTDS
jgi:hypothetical protein